MRAISNYNKIPEYTEYKKIPAGAYEISIIKAEDIQTSNGDYLAILFDISNDDEYTNYYHEKFANDKKSYPENAKYKGIIRLFYPNGGEYDENNERRIKTTLEAISKSNDLKIDFSKEWDGKALKGAKAGVILREQEYEYNGNRGFTAQPYRIISLNDLKEGKFKLPGTKYLNGQALANRSTGINASGINDLLPDDDLPF